MLWKNKRKWRPDGMICNWRISTTFFGCIYPSILDRILAHWFKKAKSPIKACMSFTSRSVVGELVQACKADRNQPLWTEAWASPWPEIHHSNKEFMRKKTHALAWGSPLKLSTNQWTSLSVALCTTGYSPQWIVADLAGEIVVYLLLWSSALDSWLNSRHNGFWRMHMRVFGVGSNQNKWKTVFRLSLFPFRKGRRNERESISVFLE